MRNNEIKKGFTLAEQMIVLAMLGVIFAVTIPLIKTIFPDRDKALFKKAYFIAERTVNEMINNDTMYPDHELGFADTAPIYRDGPSGDSKFREIFKGYFTGVSDRECLYYTGSNTEEVDGRIRVTNSYRRGNVCFVTNENITWGIPDDNFSDGDIVLTLYLNKNKDDVINDETMDENAFLIMIDRRGRLTVPGSAEAICANPNETHKRCGALEMLKSANIKKGD